MTKWLTTKTVSRDIKISEYSLRGWLRRGLVPGAGRLPSGKWRIPADAVHHLMRPPDERADRVPA